MRPEAAVRFAKKKRRAESAEIKSTIEKVSPAILATLPDAQSGAISWGALLKIALPPRGLGRLGLWVGASFGLGVLDWLTAVAPMAAVVPG